MIGLNEGSKRRKLEVSRIKTPPAEIVNDGSGGSKV